MKNFSNRLNRIENAVIPKDRFALCFVRYDYQDEDFLKQKKEYEELHENVKGVTFICCTDYAFCGSDNQNYEEFVLGNRRRCGNSNPFGWWPEVPQDEEKDDKSDITTPELQITIYCEF